MTANTPEEEDETPLTPDLPPATEAPDLHGASRTRPEEDPRGRRSPLPTPYGSPSRGRREDPEARHGAPAERAA